MTQPVEFWFSVGSTYSYLTVMRLSGVERESGIRFAWRPFSVRAVMQEMNNVPFVGKPKKERYMWRDLERRAARYGLDIRLPVHYPLKNFDRANRVAVLGREERWCEAYVRSACELWFCRGLPAGDEANLRQSLRAAGQDYDRVIDAAKSRSTGERYEEATNEARALGIFGSPTFVVDGAELFWGDDRLEDAVEFARRRIGTRRGQ